MAATNVPDFTDRKFTRSRSALAIHGYVLHLPEVSDFAITPEIMLKQALAVASGAG